MHTLDFIAHMVLVATIPLCYSAKAAIDKMSKNVCGCVSIKLHSQKTGRRLD